MSFVIPMVFIGQPARLRNPRGGKPLQRRIPVVRLS